MIRARARVVTAPDGALVKKNYLILDGLHAGIRFAATPEVTTALFTEVTVKFSPDDQFAYEVTPEPAVLSPLDGRGELFRRLHDQGRAVLSFIVSHSITRDEDDDRSDELFAADHVAWFAGYTSTTTPTYEDVVSAIENALQRDGRPDSRTRTLNDEQLAALALYRDTHGRYWKRELNDAWATGNYGPSDDVGPLQQVRNTFGPSWLVRFSFTKTSTHRELP